MQAYKIVHGLWGMGQIPGESFKRPWPPLIKMDAVVKAKVEQLMIAKR